MEQLNSTNDILCGASAETEEKRKELKSPKGENSTRDRTLLCCFPSNAEERSFVVILRPTAGGDGRRIRLVFGVLVFRKTEAFLAPASPNMDLGQANKNSSNHSSIHTWSSRPGEVCATPPACRYEGPCHGALLRMLVVASGSPTGSHQSELGYV